MTCSSLIFLHGSRRAVNAIDNVRGLLTKIIELAPDGLLISRPLYDEIVTRGLVKLPTNASPVEPGHPFRATVALSIGGDGTFLRTAQWVGASQTPILGINAGHLGFLADMNPSDAMSLTPQSLANLRLEPRMALKVNCSTPLPDCCWPYALNDVALLKTDSASMISVHARIDGSPLTTYQADGLVVSTPTGSTGYNLSVGGPIVQPGINMMLLSPVAPHQLAMRPLGVDGASKLQFTVSARSGSFLLSLDGRSLPMPVDTEVTVEAAPFKIIVAQRPEHHFAATLRTKLLWGERPVRQ